VAPSFWKCEVGVSSWVERAKNFWPPPCLKFTSVGPFEVKAGKGAYEAERPTKVKSLYLCGPIQLTSLFTCFASVWPYTPTMWVKKSSPHPKKLFARFSLVANLFNWKFLGYFPDIYLHQFWSTYHICMNCITFTTLQILTVQFSLGLLLNSWIFY